MILESGTYLKTADVNLGDTITFKDEGAWVENKKFTYDDGTPRQDFVILVSHKGVDKKFRMNKTNRDIMVEGYGKDTADWIGQRALIFKEKTMVGGKRVDCILLAMPDTLDRQSPGADPKPLPF